MGKGSPKKVDTIPTTLLVAIYAAEGLLDEAKARSSALMKLIVAGDESKWPELDKARNDVYVYSLQYTRALARLINAQERL